MVTSMNKIEIYTKPLCPYCYRAKALLDHLELPYEETNISFDSEKRSEMIARTQGYTVPQIIVNGTKVGGSDDLYAMVENGEFFKLLHQSGLSSSDHQGELNHAS